jgi:hypothetical protein
MVDDISDTLGPVPDPGRPKRPPPTIDLEPTSSETHPAPEPVAESAADSAAESDPQVVTEPEAAAEPASQAAEEVAAATEAPNDEASRAEAAAPPPSRPISPWVIAPFSGAAAAALVIGVGWMLGWPQVAPPPAGPQPTTALDSLNARIASLEAKVNRPDPSAPRLDALDKALASLRGDVGQLHTQSDRLAAAVNELKAMPRDTGGQTAAQPAPQIVAPPAPQVDLSELNARLDQLDAATRSQAAELAQADRKIADAKAEAKPADDRPLRRVIAATLLDVAVRHGEPFATVLSTARSLAPNADALKPLEAFAATGVPSPATLDRDLLTIVPKLAPQPAEAPSSGNSIVDRLQAGAAKLVRIERTDSTGTDRGAVVARITAAALRNDFNEARRELKALAPADRAPAQAWLDKADARDAALEASRRFADEAMAALAKTAQNR